VTGKPRRGLASFLSNELKEAPTVPKAVAAPKAAPEPVVETPEESVVMAALTEVLTEAAPVVVERPAKKTAKAKKAAPKAEPAKKIATRKAAKAEKPEPAKKPTKKAKKVSEGPLYLRLTRKEARLREDQIESLRKLARRLSRSRTDGGERLTENTLLRVAVDLLLSRANELTGTTESQIRKSALAK
jgi:RNA polymerase-interacting CarD/CdnL/TRCF family regulator